MTDINKVIAGAKAIERILTEQFGGRGRGMKEKLDSVQYPIPRPLQQRITYLARLRNRCVHEDGFELRDSDDYARKCEAVCEELRTAHAIAVRVAEQKAARRKRMMPLWIGAGVLAAGAAWWWLAPTAVPEAPDASVQAATAQPAPEQAVTEAVAPGSAAPAVRAPSGPIADAASTPAPRAPVVSGEHIGLGTDVLAVEKVTFSYGKDSFGRLEPRIQVTLRNTSSRTLSSAWVHARLYVNGEATPVVDTTSGWRSDTIYLGFGDSGLAPGASTTVTPSLFGNDAFKVPDAINARQRRLVLRIDSVFDGRKAKTGGPAPAWPQVEGTAAQQMQPATAGVIDAALRERFARGEHIALPDPRLEVDKIALSVKRDSFGRERTAIVLTLANRSGVTLDYVQFEARLYLNGEQEAALDTGREPLFVSFGDAGLAAGERMTTGNLNNGLRDAFDVPDALNAVRSGKARLVLRLSSLTDGRKQRSASVAPPFEAL